MPEARADVLGIAAAVPVAPAVPAARAEVGASAPRGLPALGAMLPVASSQVAPTSTPARDAKGPRRATKPHPWLARHRIAPDLFEQFTNAATSNRQRFVVGVSLSEYTVTGLRVAVRF